MIKHILLIFAIVIGNSSVAFFDATAADDKTLQANENIKYYRFGNTNRIIDPSKDTVVRMRQNKSKGFNYPYYLFVPKGLSGPVHLLVEPNNTGRISDALIIHERRVKRDIVKSYQNAIARRLNTAVLMPVFPRPKKEWRIYTHSLDRDTLLVGDGKLRRLDAQLINMIQDAKELLKHNGIEVEDRVFLHGFSASGNFTNRFVLLHPEIVKAVASGGINATPIIPSKEWENIILRYPVGISDLEDVFGIRFSRREYHKVPQYIYMGSMDENDTVPYRDAFDEEDANLIKKVLGERMIPNRWKKSKKVYKKLRVPAQFVLYNGIGHGIRDEMLEDVVKFFKANSGSRIVKISPHKYPTVNLKEIRTAHINGLYWRGSEDIPPKMRDLSGNGHFVICIDEWIDDQDYRQLDRFKSNAGFNFILKAAIGGDIVITEGNLIGTQTSVGGGLNYKAYVVKLSDKQLRRMYPNVQYTIVPVNEKKEYMWKVRKDVSLKGYSKD